MLSCGCTNPPIELFPCRIDRHHGHHLCFLLDGIVVLGAESVRGADCNTRDYRKCHHESVRVTLLGCQVQPDHLSFHLACTDFHPSSGSHSFTISRSRSASWLSMFLCAVTAIASTVRTSCMSSIFFSISISGSLCFVFTAGSPCWNQHEDPYLHQPFREKNRHTSFPGA